MTASSREETLTALSRYSQHLQAYRDQVAAELDAATAKRDRLQEIADTRAQEYRSTLQGIAESVRELETAALTGHPAAHIRRLRRQHVNAEQDSATEYRKRRDRWGIKPGDGPVRGCPSGPPSALQVQILRDQLLGSYRHDPTAEAVRINLFRIAGEQRLRTAVTLPLGQALSDQPIDLSTVVRWTMTDRKTWERICLRLSLDADIWEAADASRLAAATASNGD